MEYMAIPSDIKGTTIWEGGFYTPANRLIKFNVYREMRRFITDHYPNVTIPTNPGDTELMDFDVILGYVNNHLKMTGLCVDGEPVMYTDWRAMMDGKVNNLQESPLNATERGLSGNLAQDIESTVFAPETPEKPTQGDDDALPMFGKDTPPRKQNLSAYGIED